MQRFYIKDETVHAAFDALEQGSEAGAIARAMRERCEDEKKEARARAFLDATGNVAEREATAILSQAYKDACNKYYEAIEQDEKWRAIKSKSEAIIEAWRTCQSNMRSMGKVA
ncbi:MAG: hypothetical protein GY749_22930 [Desulfobacteraceae bacterium]|nr:hypothetical protein [Desulfobacteraceae bacterium]